MRSASAEAGLGNRTLAAGELRGFQTTAPVVVSHPDKWVNVDHVDRAKRGAVLARLHRLGFVAAARDDLVAARGGSARGLSVVEKFRSPSAARAEFAAVTARLQPATSQAVLGIPGARGFHILRSRQWSYDIAFTGGPYFYLVGVGWYRSYKAAPIRALAAAVGQLFSRVNES